MKPSTSTGTNETLTPPADLSVVSVFIVDDHAAYRSVASAVVAATPGFTLVGSAATATGALAAIDNLDASPDLVLMDVNLGDESGIDATRAVLGSHPSSKVVLVSTLRPDELPPGCEAAGAAGYLSKMQLSTTTLARLWDGAYDWAP